MPPYSLAIHEEIIIETLQEFALGICQEIIYGSQSLLYERGAFCAVAAPRILNRYESLVVL